MRNMLHFTDLAQHADHYSAQQLSEMLMPKEWLFPENAKRMNCGQLRTSIYEQDKRCDG